MNAAPGQPIQFGAHPGRPVRGAQRNPQRIEAAASQV
jgi:hypothetical protein